MKLEKNMYVRTKQGYIAKFKEYDEIFDMLRFETPIFLRSWMPCDYMQKERFMNRYFLKASHNIIDLIEVGDYVNGCYVSNKRANVNEHLGGHPKGIGIIKCNAYFNQGNYNDCKFVWIEEKDIKTIVTKEMFESVSYKVGDSNE